eukprot:gb/GECH01010098.1/.p1 GENE.gb/GECH01010098.1/~~gb/GECH01010098.1/.p1  ORF type:complete len:142 (+),score=8.46 gb/GECH01010098.1/:1-426(+)
MTDAPLRLDRMDVRDAESGNTLTSVDWSSKDMFTGQHALTIPKAILECRAVTRELTFSIGPQPIQDLAVTQKVLLHRTLIEEWHFNFGFAIPSSTNTWSTTLEAADEMLPAQTLSGNTVIETTFYDKDESLGTCTTRVFYV